MTGGRGSWLSTGLAPGATEPSKYGLSGAASDELGLMSVVIGITLMVPLEMVVDVTGSRAAPLFVYLGLAIVGLGITFLYELPLARRQGLERQQTGWKPMIPLLLGVGAGLIFGGLMPVAAFGPLLLALMLYVTWVTSRFRGVYLGLIGVMSVVALVPLATDLPEVRLMHGADHPHATTFVAGAAIAIYGAMQHWELRQADRRRREAIAADSI